jgi:hypothetical protein
MEGDRPAADLIVVASGQRTSRYDSGNAVAGNLERRARISESAEAKAKRALNTN